MKATEAQIQKAILDYLDAMKIPAFRRNTGAFAGEYKGKRRFVRFSEKGQSDIWGVIPARILEPGGLHFEIEVKRPGEKPTPEQDEWLRSMAKAGCIAFVATSVEDVERALGRQA